MSGKTDFLIKKYHCTKHLIIAVLTPEQSANLFSNSTVGVNVSYYYDVNKLEKEKF